MPTALVVGAGIGGLAAGISLRRAGWQVRVFERAPAPRELGFGIGLLPNAIAVLRELGLAEAILPHGFSPRCGEVRRTDGRLIRRLEGGPKGLPAGDFARVILRPVLHGALLEALGPAAVEVNRAAVTFDVEGTRVRLTLSDGSEALGDILVGADGVGSTIRSLVHLDEPLPRPSGYVAIRGASPAIERLNGLNVLWLFGPGVETGVAQASDTAIYWFMSLLAEDVGRMPVDVHDVFNRLTVGFDPQFLAIAAATPRSDMRIDELLVRAPLASWGRGPVTLLGDAAHPMLPHTAQGAAQALEDAAGLGRVLRRSTDHIAALRRYERVRAERTRFVASTGPRLARITTTKNPVIGFLRNTAVRHMPIGALLRTFTKLDRDPNHELGALQ